MAVHPISLSYAEFERVDRWVARPVAFGLTLSQNISLLVLAFGAVLAVVVWRRPLIADEPPPEPVATTDTNITTLAPPA